MHTSMGADPYDGGVTFRVWAPHADAVYVLGSFNDWAEEATPLTPEDAGLWAADVDGVPVGAAYQFAIHNAGVTYRRNDPYARAVSNSAGHSLTYDSEAFDWEEDACVLRSWNEIVLYELHVGTFAADPDDGHAVGDLPGAIERLDYLQELGVNTVELMPLAEFSGDRSWGYNPALPFAVESAYGGPDALKAFVKVAHARGMAVVLDVVYNHFGPGDLALWQFDGWHENDQGGIYFYNDHRANTPWGATRPDYGRPEVRQYILDNVRMWLEEFHMDGLRLDMTPYIFTLDGHGDSEPIADGWSIMQAITRWAREHYPERLLIAEDLQTNPAITRAVEQGGAGFGAQWDAAFVHPVRAVLTTPEDADRDLGALADALTHRYGADAFSRVIYTESHDEVANGKARVPEEIWPGAADSRPAQKRSVLGAACVFTAPGIPMLFQGQELLMDQYFRDTEPFRWQRLERFPGIYRLYHDLIDLRMNRFGTTRGLMGSHTQILHRDDEAKVLVMHRWMDGGPGDDVVVVLNLADRAHEAYSVPFPREGVWHLRFNSDWKGYSDAFDGHEVFGTTATKDGTTPLPTYGALIFSQD